jgi:hypothetical protein
MRTSRVDGVEATPGPHRPPSPRGRPLPLSFSVALAAVLVGATAYGLFAEVPYRAAPGVRPTLPDVLRGQDLLTLATVPLLLWTAVRARAGSLRAHLLWAGLLLYYAYSYVMYAFAPFADAFLLYVAAMGVASFGLLDGVLRLRMGVVSNAFERAPRRPAGVFLIVVAVLFAGMWLAMIVPAIPGGLPAGRQTYDIASAVHVLDLAFVLPLLAATGVMLWRGHVAGPALAGVLLCLKVTLALALLSMNLAFVPRPHPGETALWAAIAAIAAGWLVVGARRMRPPDVPWLHPSIWCMDAASPTSDRDGDATGWASSAPTATRRPVRSPSSRAV